MAANTWKNSFKNVESDNNKILYETLLNFFTTKRYLLSGMFEWYKRAMCESAFAYPTLSGSEKVRLGK